MGQAQEGGLGARRQGHLRALPQGMARDFSFGITSYLFLYTILVPLRDKVHLGPAHPPRSVLLGAQIWWEEEDMKAYPLLLAS